MKATLCSAFALVATGVSAQNWYGSCAQDLPQYLPSLSGTVLTVYCTAIDGHRQCTKIDLNSCFTNYGGNLAGAVNGWFGGSCWDLGFYGDTLYATCGDGGGGSRSTSIDTNNVMSNWNGLLGCYSTTGWAC